jgi:potassium-transporting ATPase potassium-binding subunit
MGASNAMNTLPYESFLEPAALIIILMISVPLLSRYLVWIYDESQESGNQKRGIFYRLMHACEQATMRFIGFNPKTQMTGIQYLGHLLVFNGAGLVVLWAILMTQNWLPLNPDHIAAPDFALAFNIAVSFVTNTNWQSYSGEVALSHFSQMMGLGVQNFLSAATGITIFVALARGLKGSNANNFGNFWHDLNRTLIYLLIPASFVIALILSQQGVIQNFLPTQVVSTLEGLPQHLPMGPVASQIAIKQLGSNGGGFFGMNSAHPFENPTGLTNFIELWCILWIPMAIPLAFGRLIGRKRHGIVIFSVMALTFIVLTCLAIKWECIDGPSAALWEGKELRINPIMSTIWGMATTATSNGSVNSMLSSFSAGASGLALFQILLGEVIFGGVGSGLYGMVLFAVITVFIAGLMVGRTPEYLGKKIEAKDITWAAVGVMAPSFLILIGAALSILLKTPLQSLSTTGPHGFTELLYAFSSAAGNNGSAFAGISANTSYFNIILGVVMLLGRFLVIVPVFFLVSNLAVKKQLATTQGTMPVDTPLFGILLTAIILIVGALTFVPALTLGPVAEHLLNR